MVLGNTGRGGSQTYAINVLRNIDQSRFHIDFAVYTDPKDGYGDEMRESGCKIWIVPPFKIYNIKHCQNVWNNVFDQGNYDIVHGHATNAGSVYLKIAKSKGIHTIVHSHSAGFRGNILQQMVKKVFSDQAKKYGDYWFSCSEKASEKLYGQEYKTYPHYYQIPNAINVEKYLFNADVRKKIRSALNISEDIFLCGHVGSFSMPKNHHFLFQIFKKLLEIKPTSKLVLCGDGPLKDNVVKMISEMGLDNYIIRTGNVPNVLEYMMAMDVLIFPSLFEGLPVTIVEAQATGLPVVMSDVITEEVDLTSIVCRHSLSEALDVWVKDIVKEHTDDRIMYNAIVSHTKFNMIESIKFLEDIYREMLCDK